MAYEPGVYVGISNEEYHADKAVGSTGIKMLIERPYRFWYWNLNPDAPDRPDTKPKKFGTAYHTLMLEPEKFDYKIKFGINESQIAGTLGEGEYNRLKEMQRRLYGKPRRAALLQEGLSEVSFFWRDAETGIMCKCRWDKFAPDWIVDLKTTVSVASGPMGWAITDFGYDVSGAMYSIGARELKNMIRAGYKMPPEFSADFIARFISHDAQIFAFMMQEKEPPFMVRCPLLSPDVAACGRDKFRAALQQYKRFEAAGGEWQDDYPDIEDMSMDTLPNRINDIPVLIP